MVVKYSTYSVHFYKYERGIETLREYYLSLQRCKYAESSVLHFQTSMRAPILYINLASMYVSR